MKQYVAGIDLLPKLADILGIDLTTKSITKLSIVIDEGKVTVSEVYLPCKFEEVVCRQVDPSSLI